MRFALIAAIFLLAAGSAAFAAMGPRKVYKEDGFSAAFDDRSPVDVAAIQGEGIERGKLYMQTGLGHVYRIMAITLKSGADYPLAAAVKQLDAFKCSRILSDTTKREGQAEVREIHADGCINSDQLGAKFYKSGQRVYQVFYRTTGTAVRNYHDGFLYSFRLEP